MQRFDHSLDYSLGLWHGKCEQSSIGLNEPFLMSSLTRSLKEYFWPGCADLDSSMPRMHLDIQEKMLFVTCLSSR